MKVKQVKKTMRTWVTDNAGHYPGLCAAHLNGSITTLDDEMPFPDDKDVDLLLIFEPGSPALAHDGPFSNNLEVLHKGLMVEGGFKPIADYRDAETVLANPEIAHHLTTDSILYDPAGTAEQPYNPKLKTAVQSAVAGCRRGWPMSGAAGNGWRPFTTPSPNQLFQPEQCLWAGPSLIFPHYCVWQRVQAPTASYVKMREILAAYSRLDLYEAHLALFGLDRVTPVLTRHLFQEGCEAFDLAVQIRHTPHHFQHKLLPHLRPYFVNKCQRLFDSEHPRAALSWVMPFYLSSCEVIMADGTAAQQEFYAERLDRLLALLGFDSMAAQQAKWAESRRLGEAFFSLADEIVATHPDIVA